MDTNLTAKNSRQSVKRAWLFRLMLGVFVPTLIIGLAESVLKLAGFGYPTSFFISSPNHGKGLFIDNTKYAWRFLPPGLARAPESVMLRREKEPGTIRIFVFGESAAEGDPEPAFGMPRMLETLLEAKFPSRNFEIINAAVTAINSHAILPIARECAGFNGDFWIIYMGHNEVMGPFGAGTVFGQKTPPLTTLRLGLTLKRLRLGQWIESLGTPTGNDGLMQWKGMEMFLEQQLRSTDSKLDWVHASFENNLEDILEAGRRVGVRVLVSSTVSNLRDSAPFASLNATGLAGPKLEEWRNLYQQADRLHNQKQHVQAVTVFRRAMALDSQHAGLHFQLARALDAQGKFEEARSHYVKARDLDALRFRADSRLNGIIRKLAQAGAQDGVVYLDAQAALDRQSPVNIAGQETLFEHVHFTFAGNHQLALLFAESIAAQLEANDTKTSEAGTWLTREECANRLAYTDWDHRMILADIIRRLQKPPFNQRLNSQEALNQLKLEAHEVAKRMNFQAALASYRSALQARPTDWRFLQRQGLLLSTADHHVEGANSLKHAAEMIPWNRAIHYQLGAVLNRLKRFREASQSLERALELKPDFPEALHQLAQARFGAGLPNEASALYARCLQHNPRMGEAWLDWGKMLEKGDQLDRAAVTYRNALKSVPKSVPIHYRLAGLMKASGDIREALNHYLKVVEINPRFAEAYFKAGVCQVETDQISEATDSFRSAVELKPDLPLARFNLAVGLLKLGRLAEALEHLKKLAVENPNDTQVRQYLQLAQSKLRKVKK